MDPKVEALIEELKTSISSELRATLMAELEKRDSAAAQKIKAEAETAEAERAKVLAAQIEADRLAAEQRSRLAVYQRRGIDMPENAMVVLRQVAEAIAQKRSITIPSGLGSVAFVREIMRIATAKRPLLAGAKYFYGPNASTNIGVWSPTLATPSAQANQGATSISTDSTAALSAATITPKAYVSILAVANELLKMSAVELEAELPSIFAESFATAMHGGMLTGDGSDPNMAGLFGSGIISTNVRRCAATTAVVIADMIGLALAVQDYVDDAAIIMSPTVFAALLADTTSGTDVYKQEMVRTRTLLGTPIVLTSGAPSTLTADKPVAVAGRISEYAIGVAGEISIDPLKKVGENLTYFQAVSYFNGKPILEKNFHLLKTKAS